MSENFPKPIIIDLIEKPTPTNRLPTNGKAREITFSSSPHQLPRRVPPPSSCMAVVTLFPSPRILNPLPFPSLLKPITVNTPHHSSVSVYCRRSAPHGTTTHRRSKPHCRQQWNPSKQRRNYKKTRRTSTSINGTQSRLQSLQKRQGFRPFLHQSPRFRPHWTPAKLRFRRSLAVQLRRWDSLDANRGGWW